MVALFVAVAIAIVGAVAVLVSRDRPLIEPDSAGGRPLEWAGQDDVSARSLAQVRFAVVLRGYRMEHVDRVLDDTRTALAGRDARIADLQRVVAALQPDPAAGADPVAAGTDVTVDPPAEPDSTRTQEPT